jgi:hypothetical protein
MALYRGLFSGYRRGLNATSIDGYSEVALVDDPVIFYLLAAAHEGSHSMVYGLSSGPWPSDDLGEGVSVLGMVEVDRFTGARAEWLLRSASDGRPSIIGSGSLPYAASSVEAWYEALVSAIQSRQDLAAELASAAR